MVRPPPPMTIATTTHDHRHHHPSPSPSPPLMTIATHMATTATTKCHQHHQRCTNYSHRPHPSGPHQVRARLDLEMSTPLLLPEHLRDPLRETPRSAAVGSTVTAGSTGAAGATGSTGATGATGQLLSYAHVLGLHQRGWPPRPKVVCKRWKNPGETNNWENPRNEKNENWAQCCGFKEKASSCRPGLPPGVMLQNTVLHLLSSLPPPPLQPPLPSPPPSPPQSPPPPPP